MYIITVGLFFQSNSPIKGLGDKAVTEEPKPGGLLTALSYYAINEA